MVRPQRLCWVVLLPYLLQRPLHAADKYDFGGALTRKTVSLERRLAPEAQLQNTSIDVRFTQNGAGIDPVKFKAQLSTVIVQHAPTIRLVESSPDYEVRVTVLSYDRPRFENRKEGNSTVKMATGGATVSFTLVHRVDQLALVSGTESYQANENTFQTGTAAVLSSMKDSVKNSVNIFHRSNAPADTDDALQLRMLQVLTLRVASHMVVTPETIVVPLARGPILDTADKLAENRRWEEMVERLSKQPALPSASDDAYRLYDIGVADEALGYASTDPGVTMNLLKEASSKYTLAMQAKPEEKYFLECQSRIEKALNRYDQLAAHEKQAKGLRLADERAAKAAVERHKAGEINNADVIALVQHSVDAAIITTTIRSAPSVDFDLGVDGLIALSNAHVPASIVTEMTTRAHSGATPAPPAPAPQATPASTTPSRRSRKP